MKHNIAILIFILSLSVYTKAQNLVYNGDFEIYSQCPTQTSSQSNMQIDFATGWSQSSLSPDYYNTCSTTNVNVPYAAFGYQQDCCGGSGYAGGYMLDSHDANNSDRDYIYTKLTDTLKAGHTYLSSMYVVRTNFNYSIASMGILFSNTYTVLPWPQGYIPANPQVKNTTLLHDTLNWMLVQDTFIATGNEAYLTIGNFNTSATCDSVKSPGGFGTWSYFGGTYYYIDGASVYDITGGSCNNYWDAGYNKYIMAGDSIRLGAINTDNSMYVWVNSSGGNTCLNNNTDARPWSTPSVTTTYYVTKTCPNNNLFVDTVTVYVQQHAGIKQNMNDVEVNVYPNPAKDKIYIEGKGIDEIRLFDLLGKEIISTKEKEIDVSDLNEGVYFISVKTKENTCAQKIIVQH
jgi:hypothetical protein